LRTKFEVGSSQLTLVSQWMDNTIYWTEHFLLVGLFCQ